MLLRVFEHRLAELAGGRDRLVEQLLGHVVGGLRLIDDGAPAGLRLLADFGLQLLERVLGLVVGLLALGEDGLRLRDGLFRLVLRPRVRLVGGGLPVRLQLLRFRNRRFDVLLGVFDQALDGPLRFVAGVVEALLRRVVFGLDGLADLGGVLLRLLEHRLAQLPGGLDGLVEELLRHVVGFLRLVDQRLAGGLAFLAQLLLQLGQLGDRGVVGLLALGEDSLRLGDGRLGFVLDPRERLVGGFLAVRLQLLRLGDGRLDLRLGLIDELGDFVLGGGGGVLDGLLGGVVFGSELVAGGLGGVLRLFQRALAQLAGGVGHLLEQLLRLVVRRLGLIEDRLGELLRLGRHFLLEVVVLLLRGLVRGLALLEDRLGLADRLLRLVLGPGVGLLRRILALGVQILRLLHRALDLLGNLVRHRRDALLCGLGLRLEVLGGRLDLALRLRGDVARGLLHFLDRALRDLADGLLGLFDQILRLVECVLRLLDDVVEQSLGRLGRGLLQLVRPVLGLRVEPGQLVACGLGQVQRLLRVVLGVIPGLFRRLPGLLESVLRLLQRLLDELLELGDTLFDGALDLTGDLLRLVLGGVVGVHRRGLDVLDRALELRLDAGEQAAVIALP